MRSLTDHLSSYADCHRDRRNIATHFVGIPVIVLAVATLLSRPVLTELGGFPVSPALFLMAGFCAFYLSRDARYGVVMTAWMALNAWLGAMIAAQSTTVWLAAGLGMFVGGWIVQFVGHAFEGKKPAFVDDISGFAVGPLFVMAELGFALGLRSEVLAEIEKRVGPTRAGKPTATAPAQTA